MLLICDVNKQNELLVTCSENNKDLLSVCSNYLQSSSPWTPSVMFS